MNIMSDIPVEMVKIRREHKTLYMRLPGFWVSKCGVTDRDYLVCRPGPEGSFVVRTFNSEVQSGKIAGHGPVE